jgi:hypothetical protein
MAWGAINENSVRPKEATKRRLLKGVTGVACEGALGSFLRRQNGFFAPGTGSLHTKHSTSLRVITLLH